jgi:acyl carrier protein
MLTSQVRRDGKRQGASFMPDPDHTLTRILQLASERFQIPLNQLSADDDFFEKLGINSLQALDLLTQLENHFSIELPDYELQGVTDFRTLAERVHSRL